MNQPIIRVEGISKRFTRSVKPSVRNTLEDIFNQFLGRPVDRQLRQDEFWALRNVNFTVNKGEAIGVIGDNGAGKSTLIKLLMGRMLPTTGKIYTHGTMSALTVLGLGFDPILSGRENIYINAATLGMSRQKTTAIFQQIADFAELGDFIEMPVMSYSSGMKARLGYAVAAHMEPDILLLDEVLAVGDLKFKRKCRLHIKGFLDRGGTMLLVSHDLHGVQTICTRCIVLDKGHVVFDGLPTEGLHLYLASRHEIDTATAPRETETLDETNGSTGPSLSHPSNPDRETNSKTDLIPHLPNDLTEKAREATASKTSIADRPESPQECQQKESSFESLNDTTNSSLSEQSSFEYAKSKLLADALVDTESIDPDLDAGPRIARSKDHPVEGLKPVVVESIEIKPVDTPVIMSGRSVELSLHYHAIEAVPGVVWGFTFCTPDAMIHIGSVFIGFGEKKYSVSAGRGTFRCRIPRLPLLAGKYSLKGGMSETITGAALSNIGWDDTPLSFVVKDEKTIESNIHQVIGDLVLIDHEVV